MLQIGQRLYDLSSTQADALIGARVQLLSDTGDVYGSLTVVTVERDPDDDWRIAGAPEDPHGCDYIYIGSASGEVDEYSIKILGLPNRGVPAPVSTETLDARIERLRTELAEAEAEKARDGAPEGWRWTNSQRIDNDRGECVWFAPDSQWIYCADEDGDETAIEFDAVAALVDRVRRDRGETLPQPPAPVSVPRAASSVAIPDGWEVGEDGDGPTLTRRHITVSRCTRHFVHVQDLPSGTLGVHIHDSDDDYSIGLPFDALRAFLALCDK